MPSIQAFNKNKMSSKSDAKKHKMKPAKPLPAKKIVAAKAKRRPGRDQEVLTEETFMDSHAPKKKHNKAHNPQPEAEAHHEAPEAAAHTEAHAENHTEAHAEDQPQASAQEKIEISFPGSEVLRAKLPRPFEVAEKVATDWVNDGNFEGLPLGHPLAQVLAAQGLKKAKEVEKKVVASGVIEKVAMQAFTFGMKAQQEINTIRDQVKSRLGKK